MDLGLIEPRDLEEQPWIKQKGSPVFLSTKQERRVALVLQLVVCKGLPKGRTGSEDKAGIVLGDMAPSNIRREGQSFHRCPAGDQTSLYNLVIGVAGSTPRHLGRTKDRKERAAASTRNQS